MPVTASLQERRPRTLKHGDTFAVFDHNGDALAGPGSPEGIYHRDTRHLSHLYLTVDGHRPLLLSSTVRDDNAVLICDLTNPEIADPEGGGPVLQDLLHIRRTRFLWNARAFERLALSNYDTAERRFRLRIDFAADFADIFEVRGAVRPRRGRQHPAEVGDDAVTLAYTGLDDAPARDPPALRAGADPHRRRLRGVRPDVSPRSRRQTVFLEIRCGPGYGARAPRAAFFAGFREARRALRASASRAAAIASSNEVFNETVRRSVSDLYMLVTDTPHGPYPYAGIPWFSTVFGRDALITALETLWLDPRIARGVLRHLAGDQATDGRSPPPTPSPARSCTRCASARWPSCARCRSAATTAASTRRRSSSCSPAPTSSAPATSPPCSSSGRRSRRRSAGSRRWGDRDGDGFVEYGRQNDDGLVNQGWKDSHDSVFHADGSAGEGADRAGRGAGLRLRRLARRRDDRPAAEAPRRRGGGADAPGDRAAPPLRPRLLGRGARHLRAGARRRQAALPGAHLERRACAPDRHRAAVPSARGWSRA